MLRSETKGKLVGWVYIPPSEREPGMEELGFQCVECGAWTTDIYVLRDAAECPHPQEWR